MPVIITAISPMRSEQNFHILLSSVIANEIWLWGFTRNATLILKMTEVLHNFASQCLRQGPGILACSSLFQAVSKHVTTWFFSSPGLASLLSQCLCVCVCEHVACFSGPVAPAVLVYGCNSSLVSRFDYLVRHYSWLHSPHSLVPALLDLFLSNWQAFLSFLQGITARRGPTHWPNCQMAITEVVRL